MSERNRILRERIGNAQKNGMKKAQKKDTGVRRKWPRVKEKENLNTGKDGNQNVETNHVGKKRQWKLQDKEEEYNESCEPNKRRKGQQENKKEEMSEVVVASLNGPQMDQRNFVHGIVEVWDDLYNIPTK